MPCFSSRKNFRRKRNTALSLRQLLKVRFIAASRKVSLLPYIEVTAGSALPLRQITVAPKNHVDLAERGMAQFAGSPGYDVPVVLSRLKLRF